MLVQLANRGNSTYWLKAAASRVCSIRSNLLRGLCSGRSRRAIYRRSKRSSEDAAPWIVFLEPSGDACQGPRGASTSDGLRRTLPAQPLLYSFLGGAAPANLHVGIGRLEPPLRRLLQHPGHLRLGGACSRPRENEESQNNGHQGGQDRRHTRRAREAGAEAAPGGYGR